MACTYSTCRHNSTERRALMDPRTKASLLWGVVGGLAFLVLIQGYELLAGVPVSIPAKAGVAVAVGVGATLTSYRMQPRLFGNESP
ncbi:unknown [Haloarcula marismortui ATCC 43049]|uniref:DUF7981 domain-containing protein n=1 Tax=Haloarcula marismortui (strain ATCC 43049 / DSM 3752 / JCM 8966 / VKM B-1809) TaxID=272569 RepID=Q5UZJ3_HALMA|nr:unknown [Haloarcula marismortui ATCC 43049]